MAGLAGLNMRVAKAGPINFKVEECNSDLHTDAIETTNSESGPGAGIVSGEYIHGVNDFDMDISVVYTIADGLYAALSDGVAYALTFYPDKGTVGTTIVATVLITSFKLTSRIRDKWTAHITGKATGGRTVTAI